MIAHLEDRLPWIAAIDSDVTGLAVSKEVGSPVEFLAHDLAGVPKRRNVFMPLDLHVNLRFVKEAKFINDANAEIANLATAFLDGPDDFKPAFASVNLVGDMAFVRDLASASGEAFAAVLLDLQNRFVSVRIDFDIVGKGADLLRAVGPAFASVFELRFQGRENGFDVTSFVRFGKGGS